MRKRFTSPAVSVVCHVLYSLHDSYQGSVHSCGGDKWKEERKPAYILFAIGACSACTTSILPLPVIVKDTGIPKYNIPY